MSTRGSLIVLGSGPGIGLAVASKFAASGFSHIYLLSRNAERLENDKATVVSASSSKDIHVDTIVTDLAKPESLAAAFKQIEQDGTPVECVFFNAARVGPSEMLKFPVESMDDDIKVFPTPLGLDR